MFLPFSEHELRELSQMKLSEWREKALERHGVNLTWDEDVITEIISGYNRRYGARSIKHTVDRRVINQIADAWEKAELEKGASVHLHVVASSDGSSNSDYDEVIKLKITKPAFKDKGKLFGLF